MKHLKIIGLAAVAAMALMAFAAGSASATTLEVEGKTTNAAVTITASLEPETSAILEDTNKLTQDTCTESHVHGATENTFTGTSVSGAVTTLTFAKCTHETTVIKPGKLSIAHIAGTTDGTVTSSEAEVSIKSTVFGVTITCKTGTGTPIGTLTGKEAGKGDATMDINAVVSCGAFVPTAKWTGSYVVTSPTPFGVSA
jgi:hypothetical protein